MVHSLVDLQAAINRFLAEHNMRPKPFVWTADLDHIIAAVKRGHQTLDSIYAAQPISCAVQASGWRPEVSAGQFVPGTEAVEARLSHALQTLDA